jgi:hypothetical protein
MAVGKQRNARVGVEGKRGPSNSMLLHPIRPNDGPWVTWTAVASAAQPAPEPVPTSGSLSGAASSVFSGPGYCLGVERSVNSERIADMRRSRMSRRAGKSLTSAAAAA